MGSRITEPSETAHLDEAGYQLIPLHRWDKRRMDDRTGKVRELGKAPIDKNWTTRAHDNCDAIARLQRGGGNVGVRLRDTDLVIDWDPRNDSGQWSMGDYVEFILRNGLDPTGWPTVRTGSGGLHHYLTKLADLRIVERPEGYPSIEFKTVGRQVVAPGSIHPTGELYRWEGEPVGMFGAPDAPDRLLESARRHSKPSTVPSRCGVYSPEELASMLDALDPEDFEEHADWLEIMMACHHATAGDGREEFIEWSTSDPAYADHAEEIASRWDSLSIDRSGGITYRTLHKALIEAGRGDVIPRPDPADDFDDELPATASVSSERRWPTKVVYEEKHGAKNARHFLARRPGRLICSDGKVYDLRDGIWQTRSEAMLRAEIRKTDPTDNLDVEHVNKMVRGISDLRATEARPFDWLEESPIDAGPGDIALFRNGLLDVRSRTLHPLDGSYFATGLPEHGFDADASCPSWMRWLDESLAPSFHPTLQEWMGYLMTADTRAHKIMNLIGVKRGGKSTAAQVCKDLVGRQHVHSSTLEGIAGDFGLEPCVDKRLLVVPDAHDVNSAKRAIALERIKMFTGGDEVDVNRKNISVIQATLPTRLMVVANKLPKFIDESGALAARAIIIKFETSFQGREDHELAAKLRAEMSGIANWALEGLDRLRSNGLAFTIGEAGRLEAATSELSQSPALRFARERLSITCDQRDAVPMREVYRAYQDWALTEGLSRGETRNQTDLASDLNAALPELKYKQRRMKSRAGRRAKQTYCLTGVSSVVSTEDFDD
ncbi:primase, putative [Erythrobacter sp. NAP1]|uniref:phage/plasmid primase, P4 family n=1 Tax=Erythrobacter sp. NAP1 TaxID=237727 RepID=UPI00006878D5|nr:phage/plasmid primase, P4 family [Erythrobacter sp. NAP1]EAQ28640.1 primase, putative [Erythrobacter sp. NAP1]